MANEPSGSTDAFDLRTIRQLVKLMNENDLSEIDLRNGSQRVRLRKRGNEIMPVVAATPVLAPSAGVAPPAEPKAVAGESESKYVEIKSPMLGTFYRAS